NVKTPWVLATAAPTGETGHSPAALLDRKTPQLLPLDADLSADREGRLCKALHKRPDLPLSRSPSRGGTTGYAVGRGETDKRLLSTHWRHRHCEQRRLQCYP
ncbi:MAG: hypothetical protein ACM3ST_14760, partial [Bdellovibrio bacteriovorus]